jgi:hypothetical protein
MELREHDRERSEMRCPYCHVELDDDPHAWRCPSCATAHHAECAQENQGCTLLGCPGGIATRRVVAQTRLEQNRIVRSALLLFGLGLVLLFAFKMGSIHGESLMDPVLVCLFFVGIRVWGTIFDGAHRVTRTG